MMTIQKTKPTATTKHTGNTTWEALCVRSIQEASSKEFPSYVPSCSSNLFALHLPQKTPSTPSNKNEREWPQQQTENKKNQYKDQGQFLSTQSERKGRWSTNTNHFCALPIHEVVIGHSKLSLPAKRCQTKWKQKRFVRSFNLCT